MSTFRAAKAAAPCAPPRHVLVPPSAFQSGWPKRPKADVAIGLRLISQLDTETGRAAAAARANQLHDENDVEGQVQAYNDALMCAAVARGTCDANDVSQPYFELADDNVPLALTSPGVRFLYDALERLHLETSPLWEPASDEGLRAIVKRIERGDVARVPTPVQLRLRKLLAFCLAELGGPLAEEDDDDDVIEVRPPAFVPSSP